MSAGKQTTEEEAPSDAGAIEDPADVGMMNEVRSAANKVPSASDRINVDEPSERLHWAKTFDVTEDELRAAVEAVGPQTESLRKHFRPDGAR